jgi:hypothetical protein
MHTESVSISVTDTRRTLGPDLFMDTGATEQRISIPQAQLAPLTIENFCLGDGATGDAPHLHVADVMSAQLSLRCGSENRQSIIYQAVPLAIALQCRLPDDATSQLPAEP